MKPLSAGSRRNERLIALILLAIVLFSPPLLMAVDRLPGWASLAFYLLLAWATLIALTAWLMERSTRQ
ncbi:hypothetical protein ACU6TU_07465 [Halomonas sp. LS-001]